MERQTVTACTRTADALISRLNYLDEDVSDSRLSVAGVPLTGHDTDGLAI